MSADNLLYVGKRDGKYVIVDRSASCDYPMRVMKSEHAISEHDTAWDAYQEAGRLDFTGIHWTEYGVHVAKNVGQEIWGDSEPARVSGSGNPQT